MPTVSVIIEFVYVCVLSGLQFLSLPVDAQQHARNSATTDGAAGANTGAAASGTYYAPGHGPTATRYQHTLVQQSRGLHFIATAAAARAAATRAAAASTTSATGTNSTSCTDSRGASADG